MRHAWASPPSIERREFVDGVGLMTNHRMHQISFRSRGSFRRWELLGLQQVPVTHFAPSSGPLISIEARNPGEYFFYLFGLRAGQRIGVAICPILNGRFEFRPSTLLRSLGNSRRNKSQAQDSQNK